MKLTEDQKKAIRVMRKYYEEVIPSEWMMALPVQEADVEVSYTAVTERKYAVAHCDGEVEVGVIRKELKMVAVIKTNGDMEVIGKDQ